MTGITEFSLNTSRVTILFLLLVFVTGLYAYLDYPKQEDPSITIREAVVTASFPGMSTGRVEDLITRKLEEKIREIGEVDYIKSDSKRAFPFFMSLSRMRSPTLSRFGEISGTRWTTSNRSFQTAP